VIGFLKKIVPFNSLKNELAKMKISSVKDYKSGFTIQRITE